MHKDVRKLIREIEARGFPTNQGRTHIRVLNLAGTGCIAVVPLTPGRGRWMLNLRSDLKKAGVL